ncbi:protein NipSnap homolog 3A-like [Glandiceps talaboti]
MLAANVMQRIRGVRIPFTATYLQGRQSLPCVHVARKFSNSQPNQQSDKVYELRTYSVQTSRIGEFLALTKDNFHLRTNHSKLLGYWTAELGGLGEMVHLWEYDNFAHRTGVRKALSEDPEWISRYLSKMTPMLTKQDNVVLRSVPWYPVYENPLAEGGVYELRWYKMKPAADMAWLDSVKKALDARVAAYNKTDYCKILGVFVTDIGPLNHVYHIWNWKSLDHRHEGRAICNSTQQVRDASVDFWQNVAEMNSKILLPTSFSPMK